MRLCLLCAAALPLLVGCSDTAERPPPVEAFGSRPPGATGGGGPSGTGGDAGPTDSGLTEPLDITGSVVALNSDELVVGVPFEGLAEIRASAFGGGFVQTDFDPNMSSTFSLTGVSSDAPWLAANPTTVIQEEMCGIRRPDTSDPAAVDAVVVQRGVVDTAIASLLTAETIDPNKAQVFLFFDDGATGLDGVSVTAPTGATVAYNVAQNWSSTETTTDVSGRAVIFNVDAIDEFPGGTRTIEFAFGGVTQTTDILLAQDCVTIARFVIVTN